MPFNGSGSFSAALTITNGTPNNGNDINTLLTDVASGLTNCVTKDGQTTNTGQMKSADGSVSAPGYSWGSELGSGWYRAGSGDMRGAILGADVVKVTASGLTISSGTLLGSNIVNTANVTDNAISLAKLAQQSTLTILANITGGSAVPTAATASAILDATVSSTQGVILYRGASTWAALGVGTSGQYLHTQGAAANPQWASVTTLPSQGGNSGKFLTTNGSAASWGTPDVFARGSFAGGGTTLLNGVNVASITRNSAGNYSIAFTASASSVNFQVMVMCEYSPGYMWCAIVSRTTGGFVFTSVINGLSPTDATKYDFVVFGG